MKARRTLFLFLLVAACATPRAANERAPSTRASLQPGWNRIAGGEGTKCAHGSDYAFFVRAGDPHKLMIYFQGGGACWNGITCQPGSRFYKPVVEAQEMPYRSGILNAERADNPVRDFTAVFVPYCTGDVHLGARVAQYTIPATSSDTRQFPIYHFGAANVNAALKWAFANVATPDIVLVTGESAGSIPTPFYAARIARHYKRARVVQLGDASGAYGRGESMFAAWGLGQALRAEPGFAAIDSTSAWITQLYKLAAPIAKGMALASVNNAEDSVQAFFVRAANADSRSVPELLALRYADIRQAVPGFRTYTLPGKNHATIPRPEFYDAVIDGTRLTDWLADLVRGADVRDAGVSLLPAKL